MQTELLPILKQIQQISRGEQGEKIVGAALEALETEEYRAIHAVQLGGRDIDHVLVGPGGVFVVETKYRTGRGVITFRNGQGLFVGGRPWRNTAVKQAKSGAREVSRLIQERCELSDGVWPLVVFVGDWEIEDDWDTTDVRVFTPDKLKSYFLGQQPVLTRSEIQLIASHLERPVNC